MSLPVRVTGICLAAAAFGFSWTARAQPIRDATCHGDGRLHVSYQGGRTEVIPKEQDQVSCTDVQIAENREIVGWQVLVPNCCTSYPISMSVTVLHDGRKTMFVADQAVWKWRFIDNGSFLAILSGPVHGSPAAVILYRVRDGRRSGLWAGSGPAPAWAAPWKEEFAASTANGGKPDGH